MKKMWIVFLVILAVIGTYRVADFVAQNAPYFYSIFIYGDSKVQFRDTGLYITSSTDGQLDIDADTELEITSTTIDVDGLVNVSGKIEQGTGFWANCPLPLSNPSYSYQYFTDFVGMPLVATTNALEGWLATGDASYVVASTAGTLGGIISITPVTGSNNEVYFQLGELNTDTYIEYTASSGLESWVEWRFTTDAITDVGPIFLGLAEEASSAANFLNDDGAQFADKDLVGFVIWEANPDTIQYVYRTASGSTVDEVVYGPLVAGTYVTAGIYFNGSTSVSFYINGTSIATIATTATNFPDTEELSPIIGIKNGASDKSVLLDWFKMVVER